MLINSTARRSFDRYSAMLAVTRLRMAAHFAATAKGDKQDAKIFVVGHPRCGTTTLHRLFVENGLDSLHTSGNWPTGRWNCFSDFGQVRPIEAMRRCYPNAKFILNCRPVEHYLTSLADQIYPNWSFSTQNFINEIHRWADHNSRILDLFSGTDDCLVVNIEAKDSVERVAQFLSLSEGTSHGTPANKGKRPKNPKSKEMADAASIACGLHELDQSAFFTRAELLGRSEVGTELTASAIQHLL